MKNADYISLSEAAWFLGYANKKYLQKLAVAGRLPMTEKNEKGEYEIHKLAVCIMFLHDNLNKDIPTTGPKRGKTWQKK